MDLCYPRLYRWLCGFAVMLGFLNASCNYVNKAPVPLDEWPAFEDSTLQTLDAAERRALEGVYRLTEGRQAFGPQAALHWSWELEGGDTSWYLSGFCKEDASYFICQAKRSESLILLSGYWRKMSDTRTGVIRFKTKPESHRLTGLKGHHEQEPVDTIILDYDRPLFSTQPFSVIAHRGGGRNNDLLPASENTVELIRLAARLGSTGIEIDVKRTSDDSLVLYHDERVDDRLTDQPGLQKKIRAYSFRELRAMKLKHGERIPTLREALEVIVNETPLETVWLDTKFTGPLDSLVALRETYSNKARAKGRKLEILIGIPDEDVLTAFQHLPRFASIPSISELDLGPTNLSGARVWAPMWVHGLQLGETRYNKARGRRAFIWTVDQGKQMEDILYNGQFDGLVTNLPSLLAYYYYTQPKP